MSASVKRGSGKKKLYIFGGLLIAGVILLVLIGALLPIFITNWLGGKDFQKIASEQASSFLKTEGISNPLTGPPFPFIQPVLRHDLGLRGSGTGTFGIYAQRFHRDYFWIEFFASQRSLSGALR